MPREIDSGHPWPSDTIKRDNLAHVEVKFQTLLDNLDQAKKDNNHYRVYQTKKELQREINTLQKNKSLYRAVHKQLPEIGKAIETYQTKNVEYEQDL